MIECTNLCQIHFRVFKNINFSSRYPQKCVKKEYPRFCSPKRRVYPRFKFWIRKKIDKNPIFSMKNTAKKLVNSLIDR